MCLCLSCFSLAECEEEKSEAPALYPKEDTEEGGQCGNLDLLSLWYLGAQRQDNVSTAMNDETADTWLFNPVPPTE